MKDQKQRNWFLEFAMRHPIITILVGTILFFYLRSMYIYVTWKPPVPAVVQEQKTEPTFDRRNVAYTCAQMKVKSMLRSPSTARFPFESYKKVALEIGTDMYRVRSHVDAENSFGAKLRTNYDCTVIVDGESCSSVNCAMK